MDTSAVPRLSSVFIVSSFDQIDGFVLTYLVLYLATINQANDTNTEDQHRRQDIKNQENKENETGSPFTRELQKQQKTEQQNNITNNEKQIIRD